MTDSPKLDENTVTQHTAYTLKLSEVIADAINAEVAARPPPYNDSNFLGSAIFSALTLVVFDLGKALNIPMTFIAKQMHEVASSYEVKVASGELPDVRDSSPLVVRMQNAAAESTSKEPTIDF